MASLLVEDLPGPVRVLTLHRPRRRNALNGVLLEELATSLEEAKALGTRALVVRGATDVFSSGYDVNDLQPPGERGPLPDDRLGEVLSLLEDHPAPSVALVTGPAFGAGCELACACDFRIASPEAVFCMPPATLGVVYAPSGLSRVAALVGWPKAKRLFLTALRLETATAEAWGLVEACPSRDEALEVAQGLAQTLAAMAPLAMRGMKASFQALMALRLEPGQRGRLETLRREAFRSADAQEGRAAFLEKRLPRFRGE